MVDLSRCAGAAPGTLVTILAHEYSHHMICIRPGIDAADEHLADLLPVWYGFGIFSANIAFSYETSGAQVGPMAWHSWTVRKHLTRSVVDSFDTAVRFLESSRLGFWGTAPRRGARGKRGCRLQWSSRHVHPGVSRPRRSSIVSTSSGPGRSSGSQPRSTWRVVPGTNPKRWISGMRLLRSRCGQVPPSDQPTGSARIPRGIHSGSKSASFVYPPTAGTIPLNPGRPWGSRSPQET
jgi:hypothetical protein